MRKLEVIVKGETGTGKSHLLAIIERALIAEYGPDMKITCSELVSERNAIGGNLQSWNRPDPTKVKIDLVEVNLPWIPEVQSHGIKDE